MKHKKNYYLVEFTIKGNDDFKMVRLVKAEDKNSAYDKADRWLKVSYNSMGTEYKIEVKDTIF